MKIKVNSTHCLAILLFVFAISRLTFLGSGALTFTDEDRYLASSNFFNNLMGLNFGKAFGHLFETEGRPLDVIIRCLDVGIQAALQTTMGIPFLSKNGLLVPTGLNLLYSLINVILFFKIAEIIFKREILQAVLATFFYASLTNTNLFIRHISSHIYAMTLFLFGLGLLLDTFEQRRKSTISSSRLALIGLISGSIFTSYPGYYPVFMIYPIIIYSVIRNQNAAFQFRALSIYLVCSLIFPLIFQLISLINNQNYLKILIDLRRSQYTDQEGTFGESYHFILKYLYDVEGLLGISIVFGFLLFIWNNYRSRNSNKKYTLKEPITVLCIALVTAYVFHATLSAVFHKVFFYGRLLPIYFVTFCLVAVSGYFSVFPKKVHPPLFALLILIGLFQYHQFARGFTNIVYPSDVLLKMRIVNVNFSLVSEFENCEANSLARFFSKPLNTNYDSMKKPYFVFLNFCRPHVNQLQSLPNINLDKTLSVPHFISFPAYQYEGYSIENRAKIRNNHYKMEIFSRF